MLEATPGVTAAAATAIKAASKAYSIMSCPRVFLHRPLGVKNRNMSSNL
jgi:hypothetical protein